MEKTNKETKSDYKNLWIKSRWLANSNLNNENNEWKNIISEVFKKRMLEYYLNPINQLSHNWKWTGEWFSMVAIECLLIETFAAFRYWKCFNQEKAKCTTCNPNKYYYSWSKDIFVKFLKDAHISIFENNFWTNDETQPIWDADKFYSEVRCWLLHEAQTKWKWTINTVKKTWDSAQFLKKMSSPDWTIQIYRDVLFEKLTIYLESFCAELSAEGEEWTKLRKNLWRKIDHMFEIPESDRIWFDWWN